MTVEEVAEVAGVSVKCCGMGLVEILTINMGRFELLLKPAVRFFVEEAQKMSPRNIATNGNI